MKVVEFKISLLNQNNMGQQTSDGNSANKIQLANWIEAVEDTSNTLFEKVNPYRKRLLMNKITKELIQQYQLQFLSQQDFKCYSTEIELRKDQKQDKKIEIHSNVNQDAVKMSSYIYKVRYFTNTSVEELCSTIYNGLLYIDKVDLRLSQINDYPLQDQLYLYQACLQGFKTLYEKVGFFNITEEMIFFTQEGRAKVWMNPNLSKHQPNYGADPSTAYSIEAQTQGSQSQMLKTLINLIQKNTDQHPMDKTIHFRQYLKEKGIFERLSFYKAIDEFHAYCQENHLTCMNFMGSIYDLFHKDDNPLYKSQTQKSDVERVQIHKDYDSLKNSSHQTSFFKKKLPDSDSQRLMPSARFIKPKNLQGSRISKRSANSDVNSHLGGGFGQFNPPKMYQHSKKGSQVINSQQYLRSNNAYIDNTNHLPFNQSSSNNLFTPNIQTNQNSSRKIITFCPPDIQPSIIQPSIMKYKSLEKVPPKALPLNMNRPITFSYQFQQSKPPIASPVSIQTSPSWTNQQTKAIYPHPYENEQPKKQRKQSIIDSLNNPLAFRTVNTIGSQSVSHTFQTQKNIHRSNNQIDKNKISYYSTSQAYMLDSEIAEDMYKYLGINPNHI